jgi:hypothetical protein
MTVDMTVVPTVAAILDFNMAAITNRAHNDVFYHNFGSTTDILGSGQSNGAIGDDVTWPPYWISRSPP